MISPDDGHHSGGGVFCAFFGQCLRSSTRRTEGRRSDEVRADGAVRGCREAAQSADVHGPAQSMQNGNFSGT